MSWINKILPSGVRSDEGDKRSNVPEGLWKKCVKCDAVLYRPDVERNDDVCPSAITTCVSAPAVASTFSSTPMAGKKYSPT